MSIKAKWCFGKKSRVSHYRAIECLKKVFAIVRSQEVFWKARDRELDRCRLRKTIDDQVVFSCRVDIRPDV